MLRILRLVLVATALCCTVRAAGDTRTRDESPWASPSTAAAVAAAARALGLPRNNNGSAQQPDGLEAEGEDTFGAPVAPVRAAQQQALDELVPPPRCASPLAQLRAFAARRALARPGGSPDSVAKLFVADIVRKDWLYPKGLNQYHGVAKHVVDGSASVWINGSLYGADGRPLADGWRDAGPLIYVHGLPWEMRECRGALGCALLRQVVDAALDDEQGDFALVGPFGDGANVGVFSAWDTDWSYRTAVGQHPVGFRTHARGCLGGRETRLREALESPRSRLVSWFTVDNPYDQPSRRVVSLPIGISGRVADYAVFCALPEPDKRAPPNHWACGGVQPPRDAETTADEYARRARGSRRPLLLGLTFGGSASGEYVSVRNEYRGALERRWRHLFPHDTANVSTTSQHQHHALLTGYLNTVQQARYVPSPLGYGADSYRAWEALLLGAVPVVEQRGTNGLFDGLPALTVANLFTDVSGIMLQSEYDWVRCPEEEGGEFEWGKLTRSYWTQRMRADRAEAVARRQFRHTAESGTRVVDREWLERVLQVPRKSTRPLDIVCPPGEPRDTESTRV